MDEGQRGSKEEALGSFERKDRQKWNAGEVGNRGSGGQAMGEEAPNGETGERLGGGRRVRVRYGESKASHPAAARVRRTLSSGKCEACINNGSSHLP